MHEIMNALIIIRLSCKFQKAIIKVLVIMTMTWR
uniref:Uncharacterized protein n=1 Tax=Rhizophora mucronata TaxID=61149 RepID=A0A2P2IGZ4_RHIMU